ncbi:MAG: hypothetical protein GY715_02855 [Planctomycetes bacterium]|nr:hypothetical protein [Planctomycetota bacterium]
MSPRKITLASVAGALALSGSASAGFTGLAVTMQPETATTGDDLDVYRLYATFDNPTDQVVAVGGTLLFPQILDSGGSGFFQVTVFGAHQQLPQNEFIVGAVPNLFLDSMLTIGVPQGYAGTQPALPSIVQFNDFDFNGPGTGFGSPVVITPDGGWASSPDQPETIVKPYPPNNATPVGDGDGIYCVSTPGGPFAVLIGQFSVAAGSPFSGDLGALGVYEDGVGVMLTAPATQFGFGELCVTGACCLAPGECVEGVTFEQCIGLSGVFTGPGTVCQFEVFTVNHDGPQDEWSHGIETIVACPGEGPGCVSGPVKIDAWQTSAIPADGTQNCEDFSAPSACPIPADFFGKGSDPFADTICFQGEPLGVVTLPGFGPLDFGDADTLVTRPSDPFDRCDLPSANSVQVPIQMEQLDLVSVSPITVTFNGGQDPEDWDVRVRVDGSAGQPAGSSLTATKTHCNGGTFDSTISVCPTFIFTKVGEPSTEVEIDYCGTCNPGGITMTANGVDWVHDIDNLVDVTNPVCSDMITGMTDVAPQPACDCNTNSVRDKCDIESGASKDCDFDGVPDECQAPPVCPADLSGNCAADFADILLVIAAWGPCPPECPEDLNGNGSVDFADILFVIGEWGSCAQ